MLLPETISCFFLQHQELEEMKGGISCNCLSLWSSKLKG